MSIYCQTNKPKDKIYQLASKKNPLIGVTRKKKHKKINKNLLSKTTLANLGTFRINQFWIFKKMD